jgi:hypothetical protein
MSLDEFNQIQNGMSYDQVVQIVGGPGELVSQVGSAQVYMWVGSGGIGANANVTFYNGRVHGANANVTFLQRTRPGESAGRA